MTYDLNGNTLNDGTNSYVWDARNRLVSANSSAATFAYDPLGRRTGKTFVGTNTNFLYDGVNAVQELNGSAVVANLLTGGVDERFLRTTSSETDNYLTDALGSTVALTDASGNSFTQYSYAPYGAISITGTTTNSFTYTGREIDGLGINYYRARYYNPAIGRFLSEDPMGFAGSGPNLYAYAGDDPIEFVDPWGLTTTVIIWNPVGYGESSQGHVSVIINGTSYSFGPGGMNIMPADQYLARNTSFRNGLGDNLNLTPSQEGDFANFLMNYSQKYNLLVGRNCTSPVREGLQSVGVNLANPGDPLPPFEWFPSDLETALENTNGLVSGWTPFPMNK